MPDREPLDLDAPASPLPPAEEEPQWFVPLPHAPVQALRWTGENWAMVSLWAYGRVVDLDEEDWDSTNYPVVLDGQHLSVLTFDDNEDYIPPGDWLVKDDQGWWHGDDTFESLYAVSLGAAGAHDVPGEREA